MNINGKTTALLAIDVQNDFCPAYTDGSGLRHDAGALAVQGGDTIVAVLNRLIAALKSHGGAVLATQDWHPPDHVSFATSHTGKHIGDTITIPVAQAAITDFKKEFPLLAAAETMSTLVAHIEQMLWPVHCVQNTVGAAFHDDLDAAAFDGVIQKGSHAHIDSYSAFFENDRCTPTALYRVLQQKHITTLLIGGLATDYCVLYTALDARRLGFTTYLITNACRGIDVPAGSLDNALALMKQQGVHCATDTELLAALRIDC